MRKKEDSDIIQIHDNPDLTAMKTSESVHDVEEKSKEPSKETQ